jgi:hypothetical protein
MTAEALVCRFILQVPKSDAVVAEASEYVITELPGKGAHNLYFWYYATLGLHQAQGPQWTKWNESLKAQLVATQIRDGNQRGSWSTDDVWGGYGGQVFTTAMAAMCLEVYYRYLPIYGNQDIASNRSPALR